MTTRLDSFTTAIMRFGEALSAPTTDLTRDAAIQRFEFCFELAWRVIQERARAEGLDCQSPKGCLKLAYKNSWISDETGWLAMLEDRNRNRPYLWRNTRKGGVSPSSSPSPTVAGVTHLPTK